MNIRKALTCHWFNFSRYKVFYIYSIIVYFFLALFDLNSHLFISKASEYIYRYNFQQLIIVFTNVFMVTLLINDKILKLYEDFLCIYVKKPKLYYYSLFLFLSFANIVPFSIGQSLSLIANYLNSGYMPLHLFMVNILIVSMEIIISVFLAMALSLFLRKNMLILLFYYIITFTLLAVNNIYISIPLSMQVLESQGYYITYGLPLWTGRITLIILSALLFECGIRKFIYKKE